MDNISHDIKGKFTTMYIPSGNISGSSGQSTKEKKNIEQIIIKSNTYK